MKNLDLNAYGVQGMSYQEMVNENGGFLFLIPLAQVAVGLAAGASLFYLGYKSTQD